jgi:hypothetical protein
LIATVTVTNSLIFGPGSATAAAVMDSTSAAVIAQADEGSFVYGVGVAYRNYIAVGMQATVVVNRSTLYTR